MIDTAVRSGVLGHLEAAGRARARYEAATDTRSRQAAVLDEQAAGLAAAKLLSDDTGTQHAMLRIVYDMPGTSAEEKLTALMSD